MLASTFLADMIYGFNLVMLLGNEMQIFSIYTMAAAAAAAAVNSTQNPTKHTFISISFTYTTTPTTTQCLCSKSKLQCALQEHKNVISFCWELLRN